ncbi:MAG: hypothetical protein JWN48_4036 [Myxococcaceae bacterium]|nr:hypothetical protein [Myxococcaceae bacterium]
MSTRRRARAHHEWTLLSAALLASACHKGPKDVEQNTTTGEENAGPVSCGTVTCGEGQICCNPSCGICTAPDVMCTQQFCDTPERAGDGGPSTVSCDSVRCVAGTHCELVQVQCVRAPCNPVPECKPDGDAGT